MKRYLTQPEALVLATGEFARAGGRLAVNGYRADGYSVSEAPAPGGVVRRTEIFAGKGEYDATRFEFIPEDVLADRR